MSFAFAGCMRSYLLVIGAAMLATACRHEAPPRASQGEESVVMLSGPATGTSPTLRAAQASTPTPSSCWTLIDAEEPDVLRTYSTYALYAHAEIGLSIFDLAEGQEDQGQPHLVATSPFVGTPLAVFVREEAEAAIVVFAPWDRPSDTIVRVVDLSSPYLGRTIDEIVMTGGAVRDARRIGDAIVVTRDLLATATAPTPLTSVATFVLDDIKNGAFGGRKHLVRRDELRLVGTGAVVSGSPFGVAIAREEADVSTYGPDKTAVTWIEMSPKDAVGVLQLRQTQIVNGVVPRWRGPADRIMDVSEDARVRLIGCASAACPPDADATYAAIDFAEPDAPHVIGWSLIARAGDGVVHFRNEDLVVARPAPSTAGKTRSTEVAFFRASKELRPIGSVRANGIVGSIAMHGDDVVTIGWTGSSSAGKRAILHRIDASAGRKPKLLGAVSFGGDWTWSRGYEDDRVMSFDEPTPPQLSGAVSRNGFLAALPMTTMRGASGAASAVAVFSFGSKTRGAPAPQALYETRADDSSGAIDRVLFANGRLLAFSSSGIAIVTPTEAAATTTAVEEERQK